MNWADLNLGRQQSLPSVEGGSTGTCMRQAKESNA
jgi:hypothetical protein